MVKSYELGSRGVMLSPCLPGFRGYCFPFVSALPRMLSGFLCWPRMLFWFPFVGRVCLGFMFLTDLCWHRGRSCYEPQEG